MRDSRVDVVRGVMITLMVLFHYDPLPQCSSFFSFFDWFSVSFFLPVFFVLSGYFTKSDDTHKCLKGAFLYLGVPYLVFSLLYLGMIWLGQHGLYPIRQEVDLSSPLTWLHVVFYKTISPYYYLYEVLVFKLVVIFGRKLFPKEALFFISAVSIFILLDALGVTVAHWPWMFIGYVMYQLKLPMFWGAVSVLPVLAILISGWTAEGSLVDHIYSFGWNLKRVIWVVSILSMTGSVCCKLPGKVIGAVAFLGRNSLAILVLHIFGLKASLLGRNFSFGTYAIFDFISMFVCGVLMPVVVVKVMDMMKVSIFFFGRKEAFSK